MKFSPITFHRRAHAEKHAHEHDMKGLHRFVPKVLQHHSKKIEVEDLSEKLMPIVGKNKFAAVIHNLFTSSECADLIAMTEKQGYKEALVHAADGHEVLRKDIRNSGRCIVDDDDLCKVWFERIMNALDSSPTMKEYFIHARHAVAGEGKHPEVCGLNERLRFLRYGPGQYFNKHQDIFYTRETEFGQEHQGETSYLTFLLYLNEDAKGGETRFDYGDRYLDVVPKVGSALIFDHDLLHAGIPVISGTKYACRSDIMYTHVSG